MKNRAITFLVLTFALIIIIIVANIIPYDDISLWYRKKYDPQYFPPHVETVFLSLIDIKEGELLDRQELETFYLDFKGEFSGYYDTMPENLRLLATSFTSKINERFKYELSPSTVQVNVKVGSTYENNKISFWFDYNLTKFVYSYGGLELSIKTLAFSVPWDEAFIHYSDESNIHPVNPILTFAEDRYVMTNDLITITKKRSGDYLSEDSVSVEDYNKYMEQQGFPTSFSRLREYIKSGK